MMHKINGNRLSVLAFIAGGVGCAPATMQTPVQPPPQQQVLAQSNAVCNHSFSPQQLRLRPQFVEKETNSIISGGSASELVRSLEQARPYSASGNTRWSIDWSFDSRAGLNGCGINDVETSVQVNYHLPLWPEQLDVSNRQLAEQWNEYSDALRAHHCMHGKAGIDAALEVKGGLQSLQPRGNCEQLSVDADALARSIIEKYKQKEANFKPPLLDNYLAP